MCGMWLLMWSGVLYIAIPGTGLREGTAPPLGVIGRASLWLRWRALFESWGAGEERPMVCERSRALLGVSGRGTMPLGGP